MRQFKWPVYGWVINWFIRPCPVSIKFGEPVDRDTVQALSVEELRFHIRSKIQDLVE